MEKWKIGWGISNRCNMRCGFCYSRKARKEADFHDNIREGLRLIRQNKDKIASVNFGTGEPALVPELFQICEEIRTEAPHISIGITTNGTLAEAVLDPHQLEVFEQCIDDVDVSLDYGNAGEQDRSRNYPGAFKMAERTLALCREHGKNTSIVNALHKYNCTVGNMDALMRLARIYDASFRINIYRPAVDFAYVLDYSRLKEILVHLVKTYEIESLADPLFASLFGVPCPAGDPVARSSFRILPNGCISPSTYLLDQEWRAVRIDEVRDPDDLHRFGAFRKILEAPLPEACMDCPVRDRCRGGVIDRRWLWYHDLRERDPYCPFRYGDTADWTGISGSPVISAVRKSFVHDGYLPTLIFGPQISKRGMGRWDQIYLRHEEDYRSEVPESIAVEMAQALRSEEPERVVVEMAEALRTEGPECSASEPAETFPAEGAASAAEESARQDPAPVHVVDLGSGYGRNGLYFLKMGCSVTFADSSRIANDRLWQTIRKKMPDAACQLLDMDIKDALRSMDDASADGILAIHVISHGTPEEISRDYVGEMHRVLKAGGLAAVTLPSTEDERCSRRDAAGESADQDEHADGMISFAFSDGPEQGIVHTFYSETALRSLLRSFRLLDLKKVQGKGHAHWHLLLRKDDTEHADDR